MHSGNEIMCSLALATAHAQESKDSPTCLQQTSILDSYVSLASVPGDKRELGATVEWLQSQHYAYV